MLSGGGDAVIIYEPTNETITYAFADGATASVNAGEPGYVGPATTRSLPRLYVKTVGDLAHMPPASVRARFGKFGVVLQSYDGAG